MKNEVEVSAIHIASWTNIITDCIVEWKHNGKRIFCCTLLLKKKSFYFYKTNHFSFHSLIHSFRFVKKPVKIPGILHIVFT